MDQSSKDIQVSVFARTDTGRRRSSNEDAFIVADLTTGKIGPLAATDLMVTDFAVSGVGDLLGLVVAVQKNVLRVYIQPIGAGGAPVAIPTSGAEQMVSPAFMP